ncbi:MAG: HNH endonuclease [Candidatus Competibacter sp.]|nr:HNH endonuclease [Candidatus Competibacter sp.]
MSAIRKPWNRTELLLAMNLYCRIPFGRQHSHAPEVIQLAQVLGRTPGSVAMKLNNFTSLDPEEKARGIKGLLGASRLDRQIWESFNNNWEDMAAESELLWKRLVENKNVPLSLSPEKPSTIPEDNNFSNENIKLPTGQIEGFRTQKVRLAQGFFRRTVLAAYLGRCCISDIPISELLIASHILPWALFPEQRINPYNGLCLSRFHDAAFDQGLITFDEDYCLVLSQRLKNYLPNDSLSSNFSCYEGKSLRMPEKFFPDARFISHHREHIFEK